jgi:hypothetical protein
MNRKFYYHPDNAKAVTTALIEGTLVADVSQLAQCVYMPLDDSKGKPVLGWWVNCMEPSDWLLMPKVDSKLLEYPKMLLDFAQMLSGVQPR